jgi:hypothetical protein
MQREPTAGVKGVKPRLPRLKPAKEEIPRLSREYLEIRNEQVRCKQQKAAMELAERRGQLIERRLVEFQASYLLIAMRQRMLAEPVALARRLVQEGYLEEKAPARGPGADQGRSLRNAGRAGQPARARDRRELVRTRCGGARGRWRRAGCQSPRAGRARKNLGKQARAEVARADANEGGRGKRVDNINRITSDGTSAFYLLRRLARRARQRFLNGSSAANLRACAPPPSQRESIASEAKHT